MLKIENIEVVGWEHAIRGMRNPKNSWEKSDSLACAGCSGCTPGERCERYYNGTFVGPNDLDLMTRLRNAGTDHRKFMRMITVYCDITGPLYWWKEFDTYKVGTVANSCSTMHKIHEKEFTLDDFSVEHLIRNGVVIPEELRDKLDTQEQYAYENHILVTGKHDLLEIEEGDDLIEYLSPIDIFEQYIINALNLYREKYLKTNDKKYWWQMIQLLPNSYNQKRTVMMNYEVLANIYKSRKHHKLDEWRVDFCNWIKTLPYHELITG